MLKEHDRVSVLTSQYIMQDIINAVLCITLFADIVNISIFIIIL